MKNNVASEQAVLSGIYNHGTDAFIDVDGLINEDTFTTDVNRVIYKCLKHSLKSGQTVNYSDFLSSAQSLNLTEFIENNSDAIKNVFGLKTSLESIRPHAQKIARLEFVRKLQSELPAINKQLNDISGDESLASILAMAESPIQKVCLSYMKEDESNPKLIGENLEAYIEHIMNGEVQSLGIPSGYPSYDKAIGGGFRRKCVDLISARPKEGKSVLADNFALYVAGEQGIPVLMLDTEMSEEDHYNRIIANLSGIEINDIAKGVFKTNPEKINKVMQAVKHIKSIPYSYISIAGKPFDEILSIARRWILKTVGYDENGRLNDCLIVYDYLKLMNSDSIGNNLAEFQVLGFQITSLHNFCVEYDCACVSFVQLNRDGITKESTDAVSGSDRLIWLCTSFSIFKSKTPEEITSDGIRHGNKKLVPIVARHGPGIDDNGYICLQMEGDIAKIKELGTIREMKIHADNFQEGFPDQDEDDADDTAPF